MEKKKKKMMMVFKIKYLICDITSPHTSSDCLHPKLSNFGMIQGKQNEEAKYNNNEINDKQ
jgi:hypothetical protein